MPRKHTPAKKKSAPETKSILTKSFLAKEQVDFHKNHPNAHFLIVVFILSVVMLGWLYIARFGLAVMPK